LENDTPEVVAAPELHAVIKARDALSVIARSTVFFRFICDPFLVVSWSASSPIPQGTRKSEDGILESFPHCKLVQAHHAHKGRDPLARSLGKTFILPVAR
jgi:hypothetical protein